MRFCVAKNWLLTIFTMSVAAAALLSVSSATSAAVAPACNAPFNPYAASPATLSACGIPSYPLTSKRTLVAGPTAGAITYTYGVDGRTVTAFVPPATFDAATAPPEQLAAYGIPQEPTDPASQTRWHEMVGNMHFATPPTKLVRDPLVTANVSTQIWSGIVNTSTGPSPYKTSAAVWNEPTPTATACFQSSAVYWAGLGGVTTNVLAQDGTAQGDPGLGNDEAWFEALPVEPSIVPIPFYATEGQPFEVGVQYQSNNTFGFYYYNFYNGQSTYYQATDSGYDGHTADFIAERPTYPPRALYGLLNFGTFNMLETLTNGNASVTYPYTGYTMYNGSNRLAYPTSPNAAGGFPVHWVGCG